MAVRSRIRGLLLAALLVSFVACDLPRDPERTFEHAKGGVLRVGVTEQRPWTIRAAGFSAIEPRGIEPELVRGFAGQLKAKVHWTWGAEQQLLEALEHHELDLAIGGFTDDSPWVGRIGFTRPYFEHVQAVLDRGEKKTLRRRRVLATAPGENRTLLELDKYILLQRGAVAERLGEAP